LHSHHNARHVRHVRRNRRKFLVSRFECVGQLARRIRRCASVFA
jgi:hypothetical protein